MLLVLQNNINTHEVSSPHLTNKVNYSKHQWVLTHLHNKRKKRRRNNIRNLSSKWIIFNKNLRISREVLLLWVVILLVGGFKLLQKQRQPRQLQIFWSNRVRKTPKEWAKRLTSNNWSTQQTWHILSKLCGTPRMPFAFHLRWWHHKTPTQKSKIKKCTESTWRTSNWKMEEVESCRVQMLTVSLCRIMSRLRSLIIVTCMTARVFRYLSFLNSIPVQTWGIRIKLSMISRLRHRRKHFNKKVPILSRW